MAKKIKAQAFLAPGIKGEWTCPLSYPLSSFSLLVDVIDEFLATILHHEVT